MRRLIGLAGLVLLSACNVGPKYKRPDVPQAKASGDYKENTAGSDDSQAGGWRKANPSDAMLRGKWWEIFGDPALNAFEERVQRDNQNIKVAFEAYAQARALVRVTKAGLYPQVSLGASANAKGNNQGTIPTYGIPLSASWEPDLWGKIRNQILQTENLAQVSAASLANEMLSEQAGLAQFYFQLRGQDALLELYDRTLANYRESLRLANVLSRTGIDSEQDVAQAEVTLHTAEATATAVATTRATYEHAIALLLGEAAGNFSVPPMPLEMKVPQVPLGIPSQLLERRPDIALAERNMAAANAQIGIGKAAYYPDFTLTAGVGTQANDLTKIFNAASFYWTAGGSGTYPLWDWGQRRSTVEQYEAQYRGTVAQYRQAALNAFKEVEDALVTSRQLAEQEEREKRAVTAAEHYEKLANTRYKTGVDTYLNVITAQTSLLTSRQSLVGIQTTRMTSAVQLIAALGGGWSAQDLPSDSDAGKK